MTETLRGAQAPLSVFRHLLPLIVCLPPLSVLAQVDRDLDQMSDVYTEMRPEVWLNPDGDFDWDGMTNVEESKAGTDPTNPRSNWKTEIDIVQGSGGQEVALS